MNALTHILIKYCAHSYCQQETLSLASVLLETLSSPLRTLLALLFSFVFDTIAGIGLMTSQTPCSLPMFPYSTVRAPRGALRPHCVQDPPVGMSVIPFQSSHSHTPNAHFAACDLFSSLSFPYKECHSSRCFSFFARNGIIKVNGGLFARF